MSSFTILFYLWQTGLDRLTCRRLFDTVVVILWLRLRLWSSLLRVSLPPLVSVRLGCDWQNILDCLRQLVEVLLERHDDPGHAGGHVLLDVVPLVPQLVLHHGLHLLPAALAVHGLGLIVQTNLTL